MRNAVLLSSLVLAGLLAAACGRAASAPAHATARLGATRVESTFALASRLQLGDSTARWLLDRVSDNAGARRALAPHRPDVDAFVDALLAPQAARFATLRDAQVGLRSRLEFVADGGAVFARRTIDGVFVVVDGQRTDRALADLHLDDVVVDRIPVTPEGALEEDALAAPYRRLLALALDQVMVPLLDPGATSIRELFADLLPCETVGQELADYVGDGDSQLYAGSCDAFAAAFQL